jgi:hypothetical protein
LSIRAGLTADISATGDSSCFESFETPAAATRNAFAFGDHKPSSAATRNAFALGDHKPSAHISAGLKLVVMVLPIYNYQS